MKLTYKYKSAANLLLGVLCAYSVCACDDNVQRITPVTNTDTDNDLANTQYEPDPTDTGSDKPENQDKPGEQNNQNDQDNHWEQPDENNQEIPNDQDTSTEQPDENNQDDQNDTDISDEQPDQDTSNEHDDADTADEQPDQDAPDPQDNQGKCDPGYVWVDYDIDYWVHKDINDGVSHDKQCVACVEIPTVYELARKTRDLYCPGGDDLKDKHLLDQLSSCPKDQLATTNLDTCVCPSGAPPLPDRECLTAQTRKKPLIISPKVSVARRNNSAMQLALKSKIRERKTNKR